MYRSVSRCFEVTRYFIRHFSVTCITNAPVATGAIWIFPVYGRYNSVLCNTGRVGGRRSRRTESDYCFTVVCLITILCSTIPISVIYEERPSSPQRDLFHTSCMVKESSHGRLWLFAIYMTVSLLSHLRTETDFSASLKQIYSCQHFLVHNSITLSSVESTHIDEFEPLPRTMFYFSHPKPALTYAPQ